MVNLLPSIRRFSGVYQPLLDILLPPRCLGCDALVGRQGGLCSPCWSNLTRVTAPLCRCCGLPFAYAIGTDDYECGACIASPPLYDIARTACVYDDHSKQLVHRFKYRKHTVLASLLSEWTGQAGEKWITDADLICAVPLHWRRMAQRGYNQSAIMAQRIAEKYSRPYRPQLIKRLRYTPPQASLSRNERQKNVQGLFRIDPRFSEQINGARVVLVDDVITTGATIEACCKALKKAGVAHITVLAFARTVIAE